MADCAISVSQPNQWRKAYTASSTAVAFAIKADTATEPTGSGVLELMAGTWVVPNTVNFKFFGAGSATQTGSVRVYGIRSQNGTTGPVWSYELLFGGTLALGTGTGVAGGLVGASELYADTITQVTGNSNVSNQLISPNGTSTNVPATLMVDTKGCPKLFVELIVGTATNMNAVWTGV